MNINENFTLRTVGNSSMLIGKDTSKIIKLNQTASEIYGYLKENKSKDEIADIMASEYNTDKNKILSDVESVINQLTDLGAISE